MPIIAAVADVDQDKRVVRVANDLADAYDEELIVLTVLAEEIFQQKRDTSQSYYQDDGVHDAKRTAREVAEVALDAEDINTVPGISVEGSVGPPAEKILSKARENDAEYLVIGGRKRSPVGKALFGSVTQSVLLDADRPVVSVFDDGE